MTDLLALLRDCLVCIEYGGTPRGGTASIRAAIADLERAEPVAAAAPIMPPDVAGLRHVFGNYISGDGYEAIHRAASMTDLLALLRELSAYMDMIQINIFLSAVFCNATCSFRS